MEDYLVYKERMEEIEKEELRLIMEREDNYQKIKLWGLKHYTYDRREEVIQQAIQRRLPAWVITELQVCHKEWEEREISFEEVMKFADYDNHIKSYENEVYQNSKLSWFRSMFGGEAK